MPVAYYVRENKLTVSPYTTVRPAQVKTVLQNFQLVVTEQVADGKFVKLENFVSFMPRLPVRLDLPTDDLPTDAVKLSL